jgi:hypothetical protein
MVYIHKGLLKLFQYHEQRKVLTEKRFYISSVLDFYPTWLTYRTVMENCFTKSND